MKRFLLLLVFVITVLTGNAQVVRIQFEQCDRSMEMAISQAVSIDRRDGCVYTAYANPQELAAFEALNIPYEVVPEDGSLTKATITAATTMDQMVGWNMYPSYGLYMQMMQNWAAQYPKLCKIDTISTSTTNGHMIICLKISDEVEDEEAEPEFFYMSSMHGDEVTGFYFLLRMIDTLLTSYGHDSTLTNLVNTTQIYICPDANPDGTYQNGDDVIYKPNNTSDLSGRYNGNGIDLNRTYPNPFSSTAYQTQYNNTEQENKDMIQYMNAHHFVMAACMHGGAEILNFPWDSYTSSQKSLADAAWWTAMGNRFVATLRQYTGAASDNTFPGNMYRTERIGSGWRPPYTEQCFGGDWYAISGGWQDYSNWYNHIRAFTIEVSRTKCPEISGTQGVKNYWYYQKEPLINLIKEVHQGVNGIVVDSVTRVPLRAFIEVVDHDRDSSQIYSRHVLGDYYRPIADGTYSFRASCPGYITKTYTNVTATYGSPNYLEIELVPEGWTPVVYTITATSEDNAKGTVEGGGTYLGGQTATLTATANAGYEFDHWNDGNTDNPRSFTVSGDASYTAYFSAREYILTVESEDNAKGTVAGGGSFAYGATTQISATPNEHYTFARWNDNNTQNPRTVTVTDDATYTAYFNADNYTITVTADNNAHGTVTGGGTYAYGTTTQISATPGEGYEFAGWSDGNTDNPRTITVTGDASYTATFAIQNYTITVNTNNNSYGSVTGGGTYPYGSTAILTATASEGYHFVEWNDHNTECPRTITVTGDATYTATFAINSYTITVMPNNASFGSTTGSGTYTHGQTVTATATANDGYVFNSWSDGATATPYTFSATQNITLIANFSEENHDPVYYTLTVVSDNNAMGTASGSGTYLENSAVTISATAATGHHFTQWNDGNTDNPRTVTVTGDITYTAYFAAESYSVTVAPDDATHGSTTPNGTSTYTYGTTIDLTATAAEGYHFLRWNDGSTQATRTVTVTGSASYIASFAANTYHITVTANNPAYGSTTGSGNYSYGEQVSISATASEGHNFSQWNDGNTQNPRTVTVTGDATYTAVFTTNSFQLTVVPDEASHGSTSGSGTYAYGEQAHITATAAEGYRFREWNDGNTYPIRTVTVTGNATYTAYFDAIEYTVTVNPNNHICGSTTGSGTYSYMQEVTATATPANGFRFDHWSDGTTDNPYVFNVTHNVTLIAVFVSDGSGEGIDDVEELNYRVYPNPTNGVVNIQTNAADNEPMRLYNLYGQLLQTLPAGSTMVDLSGYAKGTYFLRIGAHSVKLVKM